MIQTESISFSLLVLLAFTAFLLYAGFWLVQNFIYPLIKIRRIQRLTEKWLFRVKLLTWSAFAVFCLYRLLLASPFITLILLALLMFLSRPFWNDFVLGILFRLDNQVTIRDTVRIEGQESSVEAFGLRNLISSNAAGETIITPYHKLNAAIVTRARAAGKLIKHSFSVQVPATDAPDAAEQIKTYLMECPWSAPMETPVVKQTGDHDFQVTAFAADKFAAEKQKAYTRWRIQQAE
ncbi:MAG: mechanosensitive ion channel [Saprospiraceae bacterium]|nr:mechanosensitive ion channel [Lewinellaceae bacterium]